LPVSFKEYPNQKGMHDGISRRFYIVRYTLDPANKDVQRVQLGAFAQAVLGVYGTAQPAMITSAREVNEPEPEETPEEEALDPQIVDFENCPPEDQVDMIQDMVGDKNYPHFEADMKGSGPLVEWEQKERTDYFRHIKAWRPQ
jgi:hypothetical protein